VLHAGPRDADRVAFLEGILADRVRGHLSGEHDHRDGIHVGGGDPGNRVGDAGSRGDQADADLLRGPRVAVGGVHRALLVAHEHVAHLVLLEQLVVDEQDGAARVAEHVLDALFLEAAHHDFGAAQLQPLDSIHACKARENVEH
jgi:hypothetical protein